MSTFNDTDLFGSGPHRFRQLAAGEYVLRNAVLNPLSAGSTPVGPLEIAVVVRGRLVASNDDDLWALRDAIGDMLTHPVTTGTLKETSGRQWSDMSLVGFEPADRTDRGRVVSLAYAATFIRFAV